MIRFSDRIRQFSAWLLIVTIGCQSALLYAASPGPGTESAVDQTSVAVAQVLANTSAGKLPELLMGEGYELYLDVLNAADLKLKELQALSLGQPNAESSITSVFHQLLDDGELRLKRSVPIPEVLGGELNGKMTRVTIQEKHGPRTVYIVRVAIALKRPENFRELGKKSNHLALVYLFEDDLPALDTIEFRRVLSRFKVDGGANMTYNPTSLFSKYGIKQGRDVLIFTEGFASPGKLVQALPKAPWTSIKGLADSIRATWTMPTLGDAALGLTVGVVGQGTIAYYFNSIIAKNTGTPMDMKSLYVTVGFAAVTGLFSSTFRRWMSRGSDLAKLIKGVQFSGTYAYAVKYLVKGQALGGITVLDHGAILANLVANNLLKVELFQFLPALKATRGFWNKDFKVGPLPINPLNWAQQMIYLGFFMLKYPDTAGLMIPVFGHPVPVGTLSLWLSPILFRWGFLKAIRKLDPESKGNRPILEMRWAETINELKHPSLAITRKLQTALSFFSSTRKKICALLYPGKNNPESLDK